MKQNFSLNCIKFSINLKRKMCTENMSENGATYISFGEVEPEIMKPKCERRGGGGYMGHVEE